MPQTRASFCISSLNFTSLLILIRILLFPFLQLLLSLFAGVEFLNFGHEKAGEGINDGLRQFNLVWIQTFFLAGHGVLPRQQTPSGSTYELWYQEREEVLRTYTDEMPPHVPLSQNSAFRPLRNAVIQEALRIQQQEEAVVEDVPQAIEPPLKESPQQVTKSAPVSEPAPLIPASSSSTTNLLREAVRLFQLRFDAPVQSQHQRIERKLRRKIAEKEQAQGLKQG